MLKFFKEKDFYYPFIIWIIIVFWYLIFAYSFFTAPRLRCEDIFTSHSFYIFSMPPEEAKKIVIVAIDEASRARLNLRWPWKRSITARLIRNIASFSPKVIGLDIIFSGETQKTEDEELTSALNSHPDIVLGYVVREDSRELPHPDFVKAAKAIGFVNKPLGESNVLKNIRNFYIDKHGNIDFSIDIELIANYLAVSHKDFKIVENGIFLADKLFIPSKDGITPLNYLVHHNKFTTFPAFLVLEQKVDPSIFKDKIVLVAATDPLLHDEYLTPFGIFPGVAIVGNSLTMMLSKRFIYEVPVWQNFFIIFILGVLILFMNKKFTLRICSFFTVLILSAVFFSFLYIRSKHIQFDYFGIFLLSIFSYITTNVYKYSYLIYMRNKLKNLTMAEPVTGFYTPRFFSLKLDEELEYKQKDLIFLAVVISDYRKLILALNFKELNSLIKMSADYIKSSIEKEFKEIMFSRISRDIIGIAIWEKDKAKVEESFKNLLDKLKKVEFKIEERIARFHPKGILIYKSKTKKTKAEEIVYNMESLLGSLRKEPGKDFISADLEKITEVRKEPLKEDILDFIVSDVEERNKELEKALKELLESKKETEEAYFEVIRSLVKALEEKDTFTEDHSERVADYSKKITQHLGLSDEESELIYRAGLLHDIGKIGLPDYLLHKKGKLTEEEINFIRKHEIISTEILKPIKAFKDLMPIILHHHERFDGTGYPHGLSGDMIPRGAQILAVIDAFDAITCGRGYKKGKSIPEAIEELERYKGTQFNPIYVEALKKVLKV